MWSLERSLFLLVETLNGGDNVFSHSVHIKSGNDIFGQVNLHRFKQNKFCGEWKKCVGVDSNGIEFSSLKNSLEQKFICRNSVGPFARIKSSQPEGPKVSLGPSHTALIRVYRGMGGWSDGCSQEKGGEMKCRRAKDGEKQAKWVFGCCTCLSLIRPPFLVCSVKDDSVWERGHM